MSFQVSRLFSRTVSLITGHFVTHRRKEGRKEGRKCFIYYCTQHKPPRTPTYHYRWVDYSVEPYHLSLDTLLHTEGRKEGRKEVFYLLLHSTQASKNTNMSLQVSRLFSRTISLITGHFVTHGRNEGRKCFIYYYTQHISIYDCMASDIQLIPLR